MDSSTQANAELRTRISQQETVAKLGQQALEMDDIDQLMHDAAIAVTETLDADYCMVLELLPNGDEAVLRHGAGWHEGLVGATTVPLNEDSPVGDTLDRDQPLIVNNLSTDERFSGSEVLTSHDITSGISVIIGSPDDPWGVLGTYTTDQQDFTEQDANFLKSVANVLASAIENKQTQSELKEIYGRISDAFFALDEEWRFTYLNERAHEFINPDGRTLVGKNVWEEFPKAISRKFKSEYEHAMSEQEPVSFEEYYPEPLDAWFEVQAYPSDTGLSVYFRDVTERKERERALEQSEQRYRTLAEQFPNGIVTLFDDDLRYTLAAGQAFENLPVSRGDVEGRTPREVWGDNVADALNPALLAALDGEETSVEVSYADREWLIYAVPLTDENGNVFAGMTMAQDITERKEREAELELFRSLINQSNDGVFVIDAETGEILDVNETACRRLGYDQADLLELTVPDIETKIPDQETWQSYVEATQSEGALTFEGTHQHADGTTIPVEVNATYISLDREYMLAVARDVTERREYQRKLEESEHRYRTLAENFPNGAVGVYDHDLRYTLTKGAVLGGRLPSTDRLEGNRMPDIFPQDTVEDLEPLFRAAIEEGKTDSTTTEFGGRDWRMWAAPLRDGDGDIFAGLSFAQDITKQAEREEKLKEAVEQLEESNKRLESFASMLAHELRNPVTIGQIYSQQLPDETDSEAVEYVTEAFDRIEDMVDIMLVLTRGREAVSGSGFVDLATVVREAWDDVETPKETLEVAIEDTIQADETYIQHLFRNLFENAVEHGGGDVTVTVGDLPTGFYVADDGTGIPVNERDAVFEAGYTTAAAQGGTGLGLAFVRELAEVHEWDCTVTESDGGGARFEFTNVDQDTERD